MSAIDSVLIQWECQQLLNRALILMDSADWEALAGCYTADAELARPSDPDNPIAGRDQIFASFLARPPKTTCHMLANSVFTVLDSTTVQATSRVLLMSGPAAATEAYPLTADPALLAGTFNDTLVSMGEQWLIQKRVGGIELKYVYPV